jgi:energy-coupling factor transport system ATP-binding protein
LCDNLELLVSSSEPIDNAHMLLLKNLSYHPPASMKPILGCVNLELAPQKLGLVIGASGSGKSTLLELLSGLAKPTSGNIMWRDQTLDVENLQQMAGLVFQFPERHFCTNSILEELRLGHPSINSPEIGQALTDVGLADLPWDKSPHNLSGGQQRRLALAVQLIRQPQILLLDEPTAGLDWSMRQQLVNLLAILKKKWTLLVVTHDASDLLDIADCCWSIDHGQVAVVKATQSPANILGAV